MTSPVAASKTLPWHGQVIRPSATPTTVQPWWVQVAEQPWTWSPLAHQDDVLVVEDEPTAVGQVRDLGDRLGARRVPPAAGP